MYMCVFIGFRAEVLYLVWGVGVRLGLGVLAYGALCLGSGGMIFVVRMLCSLEIAMLAALYCSAYSIEVHGCCCYLL